MRLALFAVAVLLAAPAAASADWTRVGAFGVAGAGPGQFNHAGGIDVQFVGQTSHVWVADTDNNRVQELGSDGTFVREFNSGLLLAPFDVVANGQVFVTDDSHDRVVRYEPDATAPITFGSGGSGNGQFQFDEPGIAAARFGDPGNGNIFVADQGSNERVQVFTQNGVFSSTFSGLTQTAQDGRHGTIAGIAVAKDGTVYTTDRTLHRVQHFTADGALLEKWGRNGGDGSPGAGPGEFTGPQSIVVDQLGFVYVADNGNARVQKFTSRGDYLSEFSTRPGGGAGGTVGALGGIAASSQVPPDIYVTDRAVGTGFSGAQPGPAAVQSFRETAPQPQPGQTAAGSVQQGTVTVRDPATGTVSTLKDDTAIPVGSTVDARKGTVQLVTTNTKGQSQAAVFFDGVFRFTQNKRTGLVTLELVGKLDCPKARAGAAHAAGKSGPVRELWGKGKGHYKTEGKHAVASVRGTTWLVRDTCAGTLTRVKTGVVSVRDLVRHRTVIVKKGKSYFAAARKRRAVAASGANSSARGMSATL